MSRAEPWSHQLLAQRDLAHGRGAASAGYAPLRPTTGDLSVWGKSVKPESVVRTVRHLQGCIRDFWRTHGADPAEELVDEQVVPGPARGGGRGGGP